MTDDEAIEQAYNNSELTIERILDKFTNAKNWDWNLKYYSFHRMFFFTFFSHSDAIKSAFHTEGAVLRVVLIEAARKLEEYQMYRKV